MWCEGARQQSVGLEGCTVHCCRHSSDLKKLRGRDGDSFPLPLAADQDVGR